MWALTCAARPSFNTNAMNTENSVDSPPNAPGAKRWIYRASLAVSGVVAVVVVLFFLWGLADGSVSSFNFEIWLVALVLVAIVPIAGIRLANRGHYLAATLVLGILAFPGILYGLFILLVIGSGARWN